MRWWVQLADRADRSPVLREVRHALADASRWGWAVALVAAVAVWAARGLPSPGTAGAALALMPVGVALAWWRTWRRAGRGTGRDAAADRRAAAGATARRWATGYGVAAALIPAVYLASGHPVLGVLVALVAVAALVEAAIVTVPIRARARLLRRLRTGARAVARDDAVRVGRALWRGTTLTRVHVGYPADWAAHSATRRDELTERLMWELCGPPPRTPAEAIARPDYLAVFDHAAYRVTLARMPSLPRRVAARDWRQGPGSIVLGQTHGGTADGARGGVPLAVLAPRAHMLVTGGTQYGKSSGVRAWAVDGLTHGVFPGGLWGVDGKGSGSLAPLVGRRGVHAIAHSPEEWAHVIVDLVAPEVARRYAEMLDWRSGRRGTRPHHGRAVLILDEIQQVLMARPDLAGPLDTLARQALEANVILWVLTQRPDARDAVPGAVRDQLLHRVAFGPLSSAGAKMTFDVAGDWHRAMGVAPVPGRALMWVDGVWRTVQVPWLPMPADVPDAEALYPPRRATRRTARRGTQRPAQPAPDPSAGGGPSSGPAPRSEAPTAPEPAPFPPPPPLPRPEPDGSAAAGENSSAGGPGPVDEILADFGDDDDPAYDPKRARRRRRT